jgi:hypothetical protein
LSDDQRRVALQPEVSSDDVDRAAYELDWDLAATHPARDGNPREDVYKFGDTRVHLLHDDGIGLRYLIIRGPDADEVVTGVEQELDTVSATDAVKLFNAAPADSDKITALYLLGIAGGKPAAFNDAFDDDATEVRRAAIVALGYVGGSEAQQLVERVAADDPDEKVRATASVMLEGMREHG